MSVSLLALRTPQYLELQYLDPRKVQQSIQLNRGRPILYISDACTDQSICGKAC